MTKAEYRREMAIHTRNEKTYRVHLVSETDGDTCVTRYWTHLPAGGGDADLESTQYYDAAVECAKLHPHGEIVLVSN